ncbi:MAG: hypothetical protein GX321_04870 [Clostridiales bacterium]|nr:hypothetical protein [Clostridiales bacterium]
MRRFRVFFNNRTQEWEDGKKLSSVLKIVGLIVAIVLGIIGWSWALAQIVNYVVLNLDWIVFTIIVGIILICAIKVIFPVNIHNLPVTPEEHLKPSQVSQALKTNYDLLCNALIDVLPKLQPVLKIMLPNYNCELHSNTPYVKQGIIVLYEYVVHKCDSVSTEFFKIALAQELEMNLNLGRILGISNPYYIYEGIPIALIQVHSVQDCGAYYKVCLSIVNEEYCRHMRYTLNAKLTQGATGLTAPTDNDFS